VNIQLYFETAGTGFPLILLHGNGEDSSYFQNQLAFFSKRYRVIAVDTRGHGNSPRGTAPFTLKQFSQDLYDFMNAQKIEKAHILGFSDGGNIALLFALSHPERVEKLILNGANLFPTGMTMRVYFGVVLEYILALISGDRTKAGLMLLMLREPHIKPEQLAAIHLPVLVIAGTDDMILSSHTKSIAAHLPNSRLVFVPGDHFIAANQPVLFNQSVMQFLEE